MVVMIKESLAQNYLDLPTSFGERKARFLHNLRSPSDKTKYKRYPGAPIRYAGGKSLAVGLIVERIPDNVERVVSPFLGGGSVEVACAVELGLPVVASDIFDVLMTFWKVQLSDADALYKRLQKFPPTVAEFYATKERLKKHWKGELPLETEVDVAAYFYFDHNTSYGPHFLGWPSRLYLQPEWYNSLMEKVRSFSAPNMSVVCEPFETFIPKYENDLLYCDPHYYLNGDSKQFVGMYPHRNFPIYHNGFRHEILRDLLLNRKGGFVLSYNDCSTIREWYKDCKMITPTWQYTFGQGDTRIGENRLEDNNGSYIKHSHELLIWRDS
jgi:DNA adenine methylase